MGNSLESIMEDVEYKAKSIMMGNSTHAEWMFTFADWDNRDKRLVDTLHRWNTDSLCTGDEKYFEVVVYDAMEGASIFLTGYPLSEYFSKINVRKWVEDFTNSLIKVNL